MFTLNILRMFKDATRTLAYRFHGNPSPPILGVKGCEAMIKHWEHTEIVSEQDYRKFLDHKVPLTTKAPLDPNTAVYIQSNSGSKRLEGIYDDELKGIRPLKCNPNTPNKDLRLYEDTLANPKITMVAIDGLMGSGKTSTVVKWYIDNHLKNIEMPKNTAQWEHWELKQGTHKLLIAKPHVNAGGSTEQYGFLPGDLDEKLDPTLGNFTQYFDRWHNAGFNALRDAGYIEILPLGFIRGRDAENTTIIADETQNTTELISLVTRKANKCRIFMLGDTSVFQIDLPGNTPKKNGLTHIIDLLGGAPYFQYIEMKSLEHIVRSDEVKDIVRRLFKKHGVDPQEWTL